MGVTETIFMYAARASDGTSMLYFVDKVSGEQLGGIEVEDRISYGLMNYVHKDKQYIILQTGPKLTAMALYDDEASGDDH
jgi:quinoprotein glucose dehydrogenase